MRILVALAAAFTFLSTAASAETPALNPDITVAADGAADFKTVQEAIASIPRDNHQRIIVLVKDGLYKEKVRVDVPCVTLRGQSRAGTRIEFPQLMDDFTQHPDNLGRAVLNIHGDDFILENITVANTAGVIGTHAFAIYGDGDRTVIIDSDVTSEGNDTISLWKGASGRYYHARCNFRGSVDFVCPRGWCYVTDCNFYEVKNTAAVWHDGHLDQDMKYVLRNCRFDGVDGFVLARHHADAQFYVLDCTFSKAMADRPPRRVIYPLGNAPATDADRQRNADYDKRNLWGERAYFFNCHREGGDYDWFKDNLDQAPGAPKPNQITPSWTFAHVGEFFQNSHQETQPKPTIGWDPERKDGPTIASTARKNNLFSIKFSESVTVKGQPQLRLSGPAAATYDSGTGSDALNFVVPASQSSTAGQIVAIDLNGGAIFATQASAATRPANLNLSQGSPK
jgi:pectinesterase